MMRSTRTAILAGIATLGMLGVAGAGTIIPFTDRPTFNATVAVPLSVEDFGSEGRFPITTGVLNSATNLVVGTGPPITPGLILPGVTYSTPIGTGNFSSISTRAAGSPAASSTPLTGSGPLTVAFDSPVVGFGFDTNAQMGTSFLLTVHFSSGPDFSQNFALPTDFTPTFFGFASSATDIVSATISSISNTFTFALDNFTFPTPAAVPEPSSLALVGLGGLGLLRLARRRRPATA